MTMSFLLSASITRSTVRIDVSLGNGFSGLRITYRRDGRTSVRMGEVVQDDCNGNRLGERPLYHLDSTTEYKDVVREWLPFAIQEWNDLPVEILSRAWACDGRWTPTRLSGEDSV
jgi:hypothetical protein